MADDGDAHDARVAVSARSDLGRQVIALRERQKRNFVATLLLSQGVPMICGGDEMSRTQRGNNNAYCQDNELSWFDWNLDERRRELLGFVRYLLQLRRRHPVFRRRQFFHGRPLRGAGVRDLAWYRPDGREMSDQDWHVFTRCLGLRLAGDAIEERDAKGRPIRDDTFLILINAYWEPVPFTLPVLSPDARWDVLLDTYLGGTGRLFFHPLAAGEPYPLQARTLALMSAVCLPERQRRA